MVTVDTPLGSVRGRERRGVALFAGLPFAAPPTGPNRFRPPEPVSPWAGVLDATRFGAAAPQTGGDGILAAAPKVMDEHCLYLNVTTPAAHSGRRPVLVWIHGGGFRSGTGAIPWYDGTAFCVNGDIVVVSINYRLGALGYLHVGGHSDPAGSAGPRPSASPGMGDQIAALRWVRDNIEAFGGDPRNVTVAGESAGAMSVGTLLASPAAAGLFRRAILQSGAGHHALGVPTASEIAIRFGAELDDDPSEAGIEEILRAQAATEAASADGGGVSTVAGVPSLGMVFQPVCGTDALPQPPVTAIASGSSSDVEVLVGTNLDEMTLFGRPRANEARLIRHLDAMLGEDRGEPAAAVYRSRLGSRSDPADVLTAARTDHVFRMPATRLAEAHRGRTWSYLFTWSSRVPGLGSTHALEIPFAFDNLHQPGVDLFMGAGRDAQHIADRMHGAWIGFVREGDPGWDEYDDDRRTTMVFDDDSRAEHDPLGAERELWQHVP